MANDLGLQGKNIIYENCQDDVESILNTVIPDHWINMLKFKCIDEPMIFIFLVHTIWFVKKLMYFNYEWLKYNKSIVYDCVIFYRGQTL